MVPLQGLVKHRGGKQLPHAEGKAHRPGVESALALHQSQRPQPRHQLEDRHAEH